MIQYFSLRELCRMRISKLCLLFTICIGCLIALATSRAKADNPATDAVPVAKPPARIELPDRLGLARATGEAILLPADTASQITPNGAAVLREYRVLSASSRRYSTAQVDALQFENQFAAFGLLTCLREPGKNIPGEIGWQAATVDSGIVFWKDSYVVRVVNADGRPLKRVPASMIAVARSVGDLIPQGEVQKLPQLLDSLPAGGRLAGTERYFVGTEALSNYVENAQDMFEFYGDAEAVIADYAWGSSIPPDPGIRLLIVEYHTPQFATDSMARLSKFTDSLAPELKQRMIVKREGNYIVLALNVTDRDFAQSLVDAVKYNYGVKWLRDPLLPTNDPFRQQKAAEMLLSTFGVLGLMIAGVLSVGGIFGTTIFLKRRKQQREAFSDAGGMLRLDLDPFDAVVLGLPPDRSNEE
jgi:uncharacterized protein DUF6599